MTTPAFAETVQSLEPGDRLALFELDATPLGDDVYRWTADINEGTEVVFGGETYRGIDIKAEGFEWSGQGSLPTPRLEITNVNMLIAGLAIQFQDLLGLPVIRRVTFRQFLDGEAQADPLAQYPPERYVVERKTRQDKRGIEFELSAAIDQQGVLLPRRQVLRDSCQQRYRRWDPAANGGAGAFDYSAATCPYTGTDYFDANGGTVADPALDVCSKALMTGCQRRFPAPASLPTHAFPGVARVR